MSIWFYLFIIATILCIVFITKYFVIKKSIKEIEESISFIISSDTNALITISSNDKDLKKLSTVLNKDLKKLRELEIKYNQGNQELNRSITNISHDLRTPLTAIRGYLDLFDLKGLNKKQQEYLIYIDSKVKDLIFLTEQLFDFSSGIDNENNFEKEDIYVNQVLEDVICSYYELFKQNNITPVVNITKQKIIRYVNEIMLKRILENIISNAIKYSEDNFVISLKDNGDLEFSNKTKLIDRTSLGKIFDRFYTVENAKKSTGIGLSIAKQLVELNDGKIIAEYKNNNLIITITF